MKKQLALVLTTILALGALAACGGSQSTTTTTAAAATAAETEAATTTAEAAGAETEAADEAAADETATEKEVKVATIPATSKPLAFLNEDGTMGGYEYDILLAVNDLLEHYTLDIQAVSDEVQDLMMESGESKLTAGGFYWNEKRAEAYLIPETPTGVSAITIYVRAEDKDSIRSLQDVADQHLIIAPASPNGGIYNALTAWNEEHDHSLGDEIPTAEGITVPEFLQGLADGQYDVFVRPNNLGITDTIKESGLDIVSADEPVKINETFFLINKDEQGLADEVEAALEQLKADGTLSALSVKWYGSDFFELLEK